MVRMAGLEPARPCGQGILSPLRLPFRHIRYVENEAITAGPGAFSGACHGICHGHPDSKDVLWIVIRFAF